MWGVWDSALPVDALRRKLLKVTGLDGVAPTCRRKSCQHLFKERFTRHSSLVPHEIQISPKEFILIYPGLVRKASTGSPTMNFSFFFLLLCVRDPRDGRVLCIVWAHGVRILVV